MPARLVLLLLLAGASLRNYRSAETAIEDAQADLYAERYQPALQAIDEALSNRSASAGIITRAQLLKAEILLELRQSLLGLSAFRDIDQSTKCLDEAAFAVPLDGPGPENWNALS